MDKPPRYFLLTLQYEECLKMDLKNAKHDGMEGNNLIQDRDQWWTLVNVVMNLWVPQNMGNLSQQLSASQD
jgi:hypothetical protein